MNATILLGVLEVVLFLIPLGTIFVKMGQLTQTVKTNQEDIHDLKVRQDDTTKLLSDISERLVEISTKVSLLIDNKIKNERDS